MRGLEKKIHVLQHKAEQEQMARQLAEEQLEKYSRDIYQANMKLSDSLRLAENRQQELEFLNELTQKIVLDNTSEGLFEDVLPLIAKFVKATIAIVFPSAKNPIQLGSIEVWKKPGLTSEHSYNVDSTIELLDSEALLVINEWKTTSLHGYHTTNDTNLLTIQLQTAAANEYLVYLKLSSKLVSSDSLRVLNTAKDLLLSGLQRRECALKLVKRNKQLSESIDNIRNVQNQLIQSEKMASLGQLAAGIAHEINNPVGFINANSEMLTEYVADIESAYKQLSAEVENKNVNKQLLHEITQHYQIDYILSDIHEILEANQDGIQRIMDIVDGLATFSHPGDQKQTAMCLAECVNRSLQLISNELKYKYEVDNQLPLKLPYITGNKGHLQQVLVILFTNAVHAMPNGGKLTISHFVDASSLTIRIVDTGAGIQTENLSQIFTPFFTTKPVGSGTGLGLSIANAIMEAHNAVIAVESKLGIGTGFNLTFNT